MNIDSLIKKALKIWLHNQLLISWSRHYRRNISSSLKQIAELLANKRINFGWKQQDWYWERHGYSNNLSMIWDMDMCNSNNLSMISFVIDALTYDNRSKLNISSVFSQYL